ncbi:MAG: hypothetical protein ABEH77_05955 [Halobacteriaceae archaeon]
MRVAVDVDGVLADRVGAALDRVRGWYGLDLRKEDVDSYDYDFGDTGVDIGTVIGATASPAHVRRLDAVPGAVEGARALAGAHDVLIATHRRRSLYPATAAWLADHDIPYDAFAVAPGEGKTAVEADVLVDDRPANAAAFAKEGGRAVLFRQPWNADARPADGVVARRGWDAVVEYLA